MYIKQDYDKINFIYRDPSSIYSPYMYFRGLKVALERNGLLHYSFNATGNISLNMNELLKYPILAVTGSHEPILDVVKLVNGRQFIAEINSESLFTRQGDMADVYYDKVKENSRYFDIYFTGADIDLESYFGKPAYWIPSWAHTEILNDIDTPVDDRIGFIGNKLGRMDFLWQDKKGIVSAQNTIPREDALDNLFELCKLINRFRMLVTPVSMRATGMTGKTYEYMACKRMCLCYLQEEWMFKTKKLFRDAEDIVFFNTFEEMEDKYHYYNRNRELLSQIAQRGYQKVRRYHNADIRAIRMAQIVLHHANGGAFDPSLNDEALFTDKVEAGVIGGISTEETIITETPEPFMDKQEIKAICAGFEQFDRPVSVLEWGSGNSTIYFSSRLQEGSTWQAVEHNKKWAEKVSSLIVDADRNNIRLSLIEPNKAYREPFINSFGHIEGGDDGDLETFYDYVRFPVTLGSRFDVIIVDGRARVECMRTGWKLIHEDGLMILHDAQRKEYDRGIPEDCFFVRMTNPDIENEGPISLVFMSKAPNLIDKLAKVLSVTLPDHILISSNLSNCYPNEERVSRWSIVFINTYYQAFLESHYNKHPELADQSYDIQLNSLRDQCFGDSDFYSEGLKKIGPNADDLIINCTPLQQAWARENGFDGDGLAIAVEQIRRIRPNVTYLQNLGLATREFLSAIRPYTNLIIGQIASPIPEQAHLPGFDIIFSSFPHFVERFRSVGITAYYQPLAFDPRVLEKIGNKERIYPITFVGGISAAHGKAKEILEKVAELVPVEFWGYGVESLPENSPIRQRHHGETWGIDMFSVLSQSQITINRHIDVAENYANNMRLFEATGCGALLITDYKDNLNELFEIGKEVAAYRSPEECAALINYYMANPEEAEKIARAGQARTLRDHTYEKRMEHTVELLERHLRYKSESARLGAPDLQNISTGFASVQKTQVTDSMLAGWQDERIPCRQRALVQQQLDELYKGRPQAIYQVLAEILRPYVYPGCPILEIGCASGYYYEILEYMLGKRIAYTGADYSEPLIKMAKDYYPNTEFHAADGAHLPFKDKQFDVAISSGVLLHVPNFPEHVKEAVRVSNNLVVAHRTPVCRQRPTQYYSKMAYGVETFEMRFNEDEIISTFTSNGLELIKAFEYVWSPEHDVFDLTYLFKRKGN